MASDLSLKDFDYDLPAELIAQEPIAVRDKSRLLCLPVDRNSSVSHRRFDELPGILKPGDMLVLNDTRVMPARLYGTKPTGGKVEILLDRPLGQIRESAEGNRQDWLCLVRASKPLRPGAPVQLPEGASAAWLGPGPGTSARVELSWSGALPNYLERHGRLPLPAYIHRETTGDPLDALDRKRYQTVFADKPGAVAAPTAGLHFTEELLESLLAKGIRNTRVTLHVGPGTFLPVRKENLDDHQMHAERYRIEPEAIEAMTRCRQQGGRVIAVGTTVVRCLEAAWQEEGLQPGEDLTEIFIRPGYDFRAIDGMLTNFHLPRSTLIMLVSAFAGRERVLKAYEEAVVSRYRFFSYGDAMLLI